MIAFLIHGITLYSTMGTTFFWSFGPRYSGPKEARPPVGQTQGLTQGQPQMAHQLCWFMMMIHVSWPCIPLLTTLDGSFPNILIADTNCWSLATQAGGGGI